MGIRPTTRAAARFAWLAAPLLAAASGFAPARAEDPLAESRDEKPEDRSREAAEAQQDEGLIPFFPQWLPFGPILTPEQATPRAPRGVIPETMAPSSPPGSSPSPDTPVDDASTWSLIPVPILYADPNLGFGAGIMPVLLLHPRDRIEWIVAPSVDFNDLLGVSFTNRIYYYPTLREELFIYNEQSTEGKYEHEARFNGRDRFIMGSDFYARGYFLRDPTRRFFGFGPQTREDDETDYELIESAVESDTGYRIVDELRIAATLRYRFSRVRSGIVDDRPDTVAVFPEIGGVRADRTSVLAYGGRITFDMRDDPIFPSKGFLVDVFAEVASRRAVSSTSFVRWGASVALYWPIGVGEVEDALVSVLRFEYHEIRGDRHLPFWEQPTLGGRSRLRGFGVGRFTDDGYLFASFEERIRVYDFSIMSNRLRVELAAFLDVGRVFGDGAGLTDRDWSYVPGVGARLLIPDSGIIARGDVGFGGEGPAVFLVLGYPF